VELCFEVYLRIFCCFNIALNSSDYSLSNIAGMYLVTPGIRRHKSLTSTLNSKSHITHYLAVLVYHHDFYLVGLRFNYVAYWSCTSLRPCAKGRKVTGSILDGVIGIFHWQSFRLHYSLGVDIASNRNVYQVYFLGGKSGRCVGLTILPPSCANYLEMWEPQPPGTLRARPGL
jgi:hypothetical protein